jgi:hypothetical protein
MDEFGSEVGLGNLGAVEHRVNIRHSEREESEYAASCTI